MDNRGWLRREWVWLVLLTGVGLLLRLWALEAKGLSYDEAATALMARAAPSAIINFHWDAAFEHPPGWQLIMHVWSAWFGQSEMMLRLLPVLAGAAAIPVIWWWLRLMWPAQAGLRLLTCGFLLAKYYLPAEWSYYTAPRIDLPAFWPVTVPRVKPEELDDQIQAYLRKHPALWLVATAENEVDSGEFVPKYLTAVAYKEECWTWLDVYLCRFVTPHLEANGATSTPAAGFGGELRLERAIVRWVDELSLQRRYLLVQLDWLAEQKPTVDFRVTLRLLDESGNVVVQRDEFPIGTLLPPTTWNAGDVKPGYMVLPLPETLPAGSYTVTVGVYNPATGSQTGDSVALDSFNLKE